MEGRSLAHIEVIKELRPIPNADKIEVAIIQGWECVVKKGEFNVGDMIIYIEVDSVLPDRPEYEFLRSRGFRIKTIKLKGQVSMGLVLPLSILQGKTNIIPDIGLDLTKFLEITKYLSPSERAELEDIERKIKVDKNRFRKFIMRYSWFRRIFLSKKQKRKWPYWVSKTDEIRCISGDSILNTDKGDFTIKEICESKKSFKIKSYNIDTNSVEYKDIISKNIKNNNNDWYKIILEDNTELILTSEHPVYLPNLRCYRQVKYLKATDFVLLAI